jgi:hypothetical protein
VVVVDVVVVVVVGEVLVVVELGAVPDVGSEEHAT